MIIMSILVGGYVNPITIGTAPLTKTQIAQSAVRIAKEDPDGIWMGLSNVNSQYLIANGIKVLNGINQYPNYNWINIVDPEHKYEEVWNRYAHILVFLDNETSFELKSSDLYIFHATYKNLKDINVKYYYTDVRRTKQEVKDFKLEPLYEDDKAGQYIYKIN